MLSFAREDSVVLKNTDKIKVSLDWQENMFDGDPFELTLCAFLCGKHGKVPSEKEIIFYNQETHSSDSIHHYINHRFGKEFGSSDDKPCEMIEIRLDSIPDKIKRIFLAVTLFKAEDRNQNFGQVDCASLVFCKKNSMQPLYSCDLQENFPLERTVIWSSLARSAEDENSGWVFSNEQISFDGNIENLANVFLNEGAFSLIPTGKPMGLQRPLVSSLSDIM